MQRKDPQLVTLNTLLKQVDYLVMGTSPFACEAVLPAEHNGTKIYLCFATKKQISAETLLEGVVYYAEGIRFYTAEKAQRCGVIPLLDFSLFGNNYAVVSYNVVNT